MTQKEMRRVNGFTLLELLIAAGLTVMVMGAVVAVLGRGLAVWREGNAALLKIHRVEKGLDRLGQDLRNGVDLDALAFEGMLSQVAFVRALSPRQLSRVSYKLVLDGENQALVRELVPYPDQGVASTQTLVEEVSEFSVQYAHRAGEGSSEVTWLDSWSAPDEFPRALRVKLAVGNSETRVVEMTREIWVPQGVLPEPS